MFLKWLHGFLFSLKSLWTAYLPVYLHWHTSRNVDVEMEHKYQFYVRTSVIRPAAYMEKSWPGAPGHPPPPEPTLPRVYTEKTWAGLWWVAPHKWLKISACACSEWRDLAQLGELTRLKPFTWEKVGSTPRVTLSCQPSDPTPRVTLSPEPGLQFLM